MTTCANYAWSCGTLPGLSSTGDTRRMTWRRCRSWRPWPTFAASSDPNMRSPNFPQPTSSRLLRAAAQTLNPRRSNQARADSSPRADSAASITAVLDEAQRSSQNYILELYSGAADLLPVAAQHPPRGLWRLPQLPHGGSQWGLSLLFRPGADLLVKARSAVSVPLDVHRGVPTNRDEWRRPTPAGAGGDHCRAF